MRRLLFCLLLVFSFSTVSANTYNYTVDCITDSSGEVVSADSQIDPSIAYKITRKTFKNIDENSNTTFCIGKLVSKEEASKKLTFIADGGVFDDGSTQNIIEYVINGYESEAVTKYSHTDNISDDGTQNSNYGNNERKTEVVTIEGATSLTVTVAYGGESASWDWVSIFSGSHPEYTAASNYSSADIVQKLGGGSHTSQTVTYTVPGDSVTFAWKSDSSGCGDGYGYYAIVKGIGATYNQTGEYKQPTPTNSNQKFRGWATTQGSTTVEYKADGSDLPKIQTKTLYAVFVDSSWIDISTSYVGKYADLDGDGTPEGIIFADLAESKSGAFGNSADWGVYSYSAASNLKDYTISENKYNGKFGEAEIISVVNGSTGNNRFYIMALEDFTTSSYSTWSWYYSAYSAKISSYFYITSKGFGFGKSNTAVMISEWNRSAYGSQNDYDIWGAIQSKVNDDWFVPSRAEWAAFGANLGITDSNYKSKGLSNTYWSSSVWDSTCAYGVGFYGGYIVGIDFNGYRYVRLAKTF